MEIVGSQGRFGVDYAPQMSPDAALSGPATAERGELRQAFDAFVGQTFYGQMLQAMRKTVDKPAYFHGGQAEETFAKHLDQILAEKMSEATAGDFSGAMFEQFRLVSAGR